MIFRPQMFDMFSLKFVMSLATSQDKTILTRLIEEIVTPHFRSDEHSNFFNPPSAVRKIIREKPHINNI